MSDTVARDSQAAITAGSQSFAAAARLFDRRTREDAVMLYAWCRHCDDVIDGQVLGHGQRAFSVAEQLQHLKNLQQQTDLALQTDAPVEPSFEALRRVVRRNDIDPRDPHDLLRGFEMDVERRAYATMEDLAVYCYHVAGVVGVMMAQIMGVRDEAVLDRACDLGIAFQLTNIARDIVEDAQAGRCYLPDDVLASVDLPSADLVDPSRRPDVHRAALILLDRADAYYASAFSGLPDLPARSAWAIAAARRVYRAIGQRIRRQGARAWDRRTGTSGVTKLRLMMLASGDVAVTRLYRRGASRDGLFSRSGRVPRTVFPAASSL